MMNKIQTTQRVYRLFTYCHNRHAICVLGSDSNDCPAVFERTDLLGCKFQSKTHDGLSLFVLIQAQETTSPHIQTQTTFNTVAKKYRDISNTDMYVQFTVTMPVALLTHCIEREFISLCIY